MQAITQRRYGPPRLVLEDLPMPQPGPHDVRVRVRAASMHPDVWHAVTGRPWALRLMGSGLLRPKNPVPGTDLAGVVDAVGPQVTRFHPGDRVFGEAQTGHQWMNCGTFAEFALAKADALEPMPPLSFEEAAAVPTSALIAWRTLYQEGNLEEGQRVLINGAGGGVGSFAVQLAKARSAHVTAVDLRAKHKMLIDLGADEVWPADQDYTRCGQMFDVVYDVPGNRPWRRIKRVVKPDGRYVLVGHDGFGRSRGRVLGSIGKFLSLLLRAPFDRRLPRINAETAKEPPLEAIVPLLADGRLEPYVGRTFHLEHAQAAMDHMQSGEALGKTVLRIGSDADD